MNKKSNMLVFLALVAAIVTFACGGGSAIATKVPPQATQPTEVIVAPTDQSPQTNSGVLEIKSMNSYTDSFNDYNVSGELVNNTNDTLENITLTLRITDETGASLLKDSDGNPVDSLEIEPLILVLVPGASTPFNYYISADDVKPAKFDVSIKSFDKSSAADPADISIENVQSKDLDGGDVVITGELINQTSKQVDVEVLAGSLLDDADNVLAATSTLTYSRYLYPAGDTQGRDRGPFILRIYGPVENATQWKVYARAIENTYEMSSDVDIQVESSYMDTYGDYHLLGTVKNVGTGQISPAVIAGLYNSDKSIFDATSLNVPLYLNPGETAPFDLYTFQVVGSGDQAAPAEQVVKPDFYWTFNTDYEIASLEASNVSIKSDGSIWTVNGKVTNTSDKKLSSIVVVIKFLDENKKVMATSSTYIYAPEGSDVINPGVSSDFSMSVYGADGWDLSSQDYQIIVQGVVSQ